MCQEVGVKNGGTLKTFGGVTEDFEDGVILSVMNYLVRVKGTYPEGLSLFVVLLKNGDRRMDGHNTLLKFNIGVRMCKTKKPVFGPIKVIE